MLSYCLLIFCCFDYASLFPLANCNADTRGLMAFADCGGEVNEQATFIKTFGDYMSSNTKNRDRVETIVALMTSNQCSKTSDKYLLPTYKYNDTLPISLIMKQAKNSKEDLSSDCSQLFVIFIFLFNMTDIQNNSNTLINDIIDSDKENSANNIFFIIQSFESPSQNYTSIDFMYFTSTFKSLNITDIFNKICDMNVENNVLSYSGRSFVKRDYRIVNQLSVISSTDARCYCLGKHVMKLLSLESFEEFVDIVQYINELSITKVISGVNVYLGLDKIYNGFIWANGNPYDYCPPARRLETDYSCFYLNLSASTKTIMNDRSLYNLCKYMVEIDCDKHIEHSLVVCEGKTIIPKQSLKQFNKQIITDTNTEIVTFTESHTQFLFKAFSGQDFFVPIFFDECNLQNESKSTVVDTYVCTNYLYKQIDYEVYNGRSTFINLLNRGRDSFYTFKKVDNSKCEMYDKCETASYTEIEERFWNQTVEYLQCESDKSQYSLKCIKHYNNQCEDNSHLQNCENHICPEPFIKCLNSYCIFPEMINNMEIDCPYGEDETIKVNDYGNAEYLCSVKFTLGLKDICLDSNSFNELLSITEKNSEFVCHRPCPNNHKCISSKIQESDSNKDQIIIRSIKIADKLYLIENVVLTYGERLTNLEMFSILSFNGNTCYLRNFDYEFQYWKLKELIVLDVSYNRFNHSRYLKSIEQFLQLKLLNLSHNEDLIIDPLFNFPRSLEIIDLSYTNIKSLGNQAFVELKNLKHLNLSHTLIITFEDMGLPEYFTLDTFYIQHLKRQRINTNFFRGLTIHSELMASDYVTCCPQILNPNISVDKCYAPVNFISSCKHLVGDTFKRIVIWIVGFSTLVGNGIVLVYRIGWNRDVFKKAYGLFILGLAISDFIMGLYLTIIASVDAYYKDIYVIEDFQWRHGFFCMFCGFLSTLSSEASTFFVCLITVDRFLCITYPFGEHTFSKTGKLLSFTLVWVLGLALALIPVVLSDWEIYSSNGLCLALPLSPTVDKGWIFSFVVFVVLNFVLFLLIGFGQLTIFINLIKVKKSISSVTQNTQRRAEDLSVAKKLALVAVTDFCCWFPVGILGFLSFNGYIFNREVYAWIAVFVLPINSALNPIIYTIPVVYTKCKTLGGLNSITFQSTFVM